MEPLVIRIKHIIDFGKTVTIVGADVYSSAPITIHVEHSPFQSQWSRRVNQPHSPPMTFEASGLVLHLSFEPEVRDAAE